MATNFYFNNYMSSMEQQLIEDLVVESIKMYGHDIYYMARTVVDRDDVFQEMGTAEFNNAVQIEAYIVDVQGFTGDGKFLSKFGLEIRDEMTFAISTRSFNEEVSRTFDQKRPNEGDVIFLPLNGKAFQIKYVDHETVFYQIGSLQFYTIICELFEYSNEIFNTGIDAIDQKYNAVSTDMEPYAILTEAGEILTDEDDNILVTEDYDLEIILPDSQNEEIQDEADLVVDWTDRDPFSENGVY